MSVFKRANWHSGLTYQQTCPECKTTVTYTDESLDFRPWFADGFVYCPTCQKPLRHNEGYALNAQGPNNNRTVDGATTATEVAIFCPNCGKKFLPGDNFCANCGRKR